MQPTFPITYLNTYSSKDVENGEYAKVWSDAVVKRAKELFNEIGCKLYLIEQYINYETTDFIFGYITHYDEPLDENDVFHIFNDITSGSKYMCFAIADNKITLNVIRDDEGQFPINHQDLFKYAYQRDDKSLQAIIGLDNKQEPIYLDLTKHLLIEQDDASTIVFDGILASLIYQYRNDELNFLVLTPNSFEFISYDRLSYLLEPVSDSFYCISTLLELETVIEERELKNEVEIHPKHQPLIVMIHDYNELERHNPELNYVVNRLIKRCIDVGIIFVIQQKANTFVNTSFNELIEQTISLSKYKLFSTENDIEKLGDYEFVYQQDDVLKKGTTYELTTDELERIVDRFEK